MGVPKFYRWISERYPCLSEVVRENQIPEFDNLYLDMNGIIHTCSHPNDEDAHFRITEEQIFKDIFHYIEVLFRIIRPQKCFFMAVDGVAPRAKMNQQRGRRFMSARNAENVVKAAKSRGEVLPTEDRFDSNCITPGTVFMAKLHKQLQYFVHMKISTDETWQGVRVYLSGHDVPGEGEHKIMDFIRSERSNPSYDANTRHCLYGLDADLIMLGLCSHEPHFSLLREEIKFIRPRDKGRKNQTSRTSNPEETTFHLLHLSLLREYLGFEFQDLKRILGDEFDLEKVIDDWVMMGFLVGNDFIPHLPNMHIHNDALPILYDVYKRAMSELKGYINEAGYLNLARFEKFLEFLSQHDRSCFEDEYEGIEFLRGKRGDESEAAAEIEKELQPFDCEDQDVVESELEPSVALPESMRTHGGGLDVTAGLPSKGAFDNTSEEEDLSDEEIMTASEALSKGFIGQPPDEDEDDDEGPWTKVLEREFRQHKRSYYQMKMDYNNITKEELHDQAAGYVRAIQWNLHYYYHGCCSWNWYYPHHYAPYLSDIRGVANLKLEYELSEPFQPFQQLLAVLPAASRTLLPRPYQDLMTSPTSPIIDFYPMDFETDLNGKKNDWEAVVLIPFLDEKRLLAAMEPVSNGLTDEEKFRNRHGAHNLYTTVANHLAEKGERKFPSSLPGLFPDILRDLAECTLVDRKDFAIPRERIRWGLLSGVRLDVYFPGFPTMKHLPHKAELKRGSVKVFQMNSRGYNMILQILPREEMKGKLHDLAQRLINKEVHINWPVLKLAKVVGISDSIESREIPEKEEDIGDEIIGKTLTDKEKRTWELHQDNFQWSNFLKRGIEIGETSVICYVKELLGKRYMTNKAGETVLEKQWNNNKEPVALQTIVESLSVQETALKEKLTVAEAFPKDCDVFLLSKDVHYGAPAKVTASELEKGRLVVRAVLPDEPDLKTVVQQERHLSLHWYPGYAAANKVGISSHLLSRLTGSVFLMPSEPEEKDDVSSQGSYNSQKQCIGLNLKSAKRGEEVADYTRRVGDGNWMYSALVVKLLREYQEKFPVLIRYLNEVSTSNDVYYAETIWDSETGKTKMYELLDWLKQLPCYNATKQTCDTATVDCKMIEAIEEEVDRFRERGIPEKRLKLAVKPTVLYRPCLNRGNALADTTVTFYLYDRVVNVREGHTVPLGLRGTVVGIHRGKGQADIRLDVVFDREFYGGMCLRSSKKCGYQMPNCSLINLSHGRRSCLSQEKNLENAKNNQGRKESQRNQEMTFHAKPRQQQVKPHLGPVQQLPMRKPAKFGSSQNQEIPYGMPPAMYDKMVHGRAMGLPPGQVGPPMGHQVANRTDATVPSVQPGSTINNKALGSENAEDTPNRQEKSIFNEVFGFGKANEAELSKDPISVEMTAANVNSVEQQTEALKNLLNISRENSSASSREANKAVEVPDVPAFDLERAMARWQQLLGYCQRSGLPMPMFSDVRQHLSQEEKSFEVDLQVGIHRYNSGKCPTEETARDFVVTIALEKMAHMAHNLARHPNFELQRHGGPQNQVQFSRAGYIPYQVRQDAPYGRPPNPTDLPQIPFASRFGGGVPPVPRHQQWQRGLQPPQRQFHGGNRGREPQGGHRGRGRAEGNWREESHQMFVPLQVIKKQQSPAYLRGTQQRPTTGKTLNSPASQSSVRQQDSAGPRSAAAAVPPAASKAVNALNISSSGTSGGSRVSTGSPSKRTRKGKSRIAANLGQTESGN